MFASLAALLLAATPGDVTPVAFAQAVARAGKTAGPESAVRADEVQLAGQAGLSFLGLNSQLRIQSGYRHRHGGRACVESVDAPGTRRGAGAARGGAPLRLRGATSVS